MTKSRLYSQIIRTELIILFFTIFIAVIVDLLGFDFYQYIFIISGMLLGSIATFGYIRTKQEGEK